MSEDNRDRNVWDRVLDSFRSELDGDEFRRWFEPTAYASDSGDRITVWAPSEAVRRHLSTHYYQTIHQALDHLGRGDASLRIVVAGCDEEEEED